MRSSCFIYLAGRYSRREELCQYREALLALGFHVVARWLDGAHQISDSGEPLSEAGVQLIEGDSAGGRRLREEMLFHDVSDVMAADTVISFTEPPRSSGNRGGRHVEFGIALCARKRLIVVGHRENLFHWHPDVSFCASWQECLTLLTTVETQTVQTDREGVMPTYGE
jgi:hypothetical protein